MPKPQRNREVELNFDGLADSVTNLVGALILLVMLLIGATREIASRFSSSGSTFPNAAGVDLERPKTADELLRQVEQLRLMLAATDQDIGQAERRLADLKRRAEALETP